MLHINCYFFFGNIFVAYLVSGTQVRNSKEEIYCRFTHLSCSYQNSQDGDITDTNRQGKKREKGR